MPDEELNIDIGSAVDSISESLGFTEDAPVEDSGEAPASSSPPDTAAADAPVGASVNPPASETPAPAAIPPLPKSWRKEAGEHWEKLPELVRQEVLKREEDILRGLEEYKGRAAVGERFGKVLQPFAPYLQQTGVPPEQAIQTMLASHIYLSQGNAAQKIQAIQKLASEYGIDLAQAGYNQPAIDPEIQQLRQTVQSLSGQLNGLTHSQQQAKLNENMQVVNAFAASPDNPFFEEVAGEVVALIESGVAKDLKSAYDKAIWQNPVTRAKMIEREKAAEKAKADVAAKERAEAARKASAANVRTMERSGKPTAPLGSMDDTLAETFREIQSRAA